MELGVPELILAAITILTPLLTAVANQSKWDSKTKNGVAFGVALLLAVVYLAVTGGFADLSDVPATILAVYGLQQLVYKQFLSELAKKVEAATSVKTGETVVVEDDKENKVIDNGGIDAKVVIVGDDAGSDVDYSNGVDRREQPLG